MFKKLPNSISKLQQINTSSKMQIRRKMMLKDCKIPSPKYFVIDCDVGGDDALCIIMAALICKKYDKVLLGVTCVAGNTTLPNVVTNALISCKIAGLKVPIFRGAQKNMLGRPIVQHADNYFHSDGLSGNQSKYINVLEPEDYKMIQQQKACDFIIECAHKYKNDFGIIAIGCMTNLALAYLLDNEITNYVTCVSCMGGTISNTGRRDHFASDFNFHLDPQGTQVVFDNFKNIVLTTLEYPQTYKFDAGNGVFGGKSSTTRKRQYANDLYSKIIYPTLCDPVTLFPLFFAQQAQVQVYYAPCQVILGGRRTRGSLSIGWMDRGEDTKNLMMVSSMKRELVNKIVIEALDTEW